MYLCIEGEGCIAWASVRPSVWLLCEDAKCCVAANMHFAKSRRSLGMRTYSLAAHQTLLLSWEGEGKALHYPGLLADMLGILNPDSTSRFLEKNIGVGSGSGTPETARPFNPSLF